MREIPVQFLEAKLLMKQKNWNEYDLEKAGFGDKLHARKFYSYKEAASLERSLSADAFEVGVLGE
eukprot:CAMPEP_0168625164 /NCGR_PEP_ID=MMETSP0449_2-20121227/9848_1 /TAXON_ID=1082188 /ORGANISM="Strombidium rassoulzadegani, Strain ras09" /LENGTH=64 /DNA_ID=CAMNT_0008666865 /DNA_START=397 /DNA_END=591 /DNA_ORIENTATION=-